MVWIVAGSVVVLSLTGWRLINPRDHHPFPFLRDHAIVDVAVRGPGSWPASEIRSYSWKEPWQSVVASARKELPAYGLNERPQSKHVPNQVEWMGETVDGGPCGIGSDIEVVIARGRSRPLRESERLTDGDPEWVTVIVKTYLEDHWVNIIRYTFFPMAD